MPRGCVVLLRLRYKRIGIIDHGLACDHRGAEYCPQFPDGNPAVLRAGERTGG